MATSVQLITAPGGTSVFACTLEYLRQSDIRVYLNGVLTTAYSWSSPTTSNIVFVSSPVVGTQIRFTRLTDVTTQLHLYNGGAPFTKYTLDENFRQLRLALQDARETGSAYGIAVGNGFVGTTAEWLASLVGATGPTGSVGPIGPVGPPNALSIGSVTNGATAAATLTGAPPTQVLNLVLPKGDPGLAGGKGDTGAVGPANTLSIGTVTNGVTAAATITGTAPAQTLNLVLPKGDKGDQGIQGLPGAGTNVTAKDEGTVLTSVMTSLNFVGANVTATASGTDVTVSIGGTTDITQDIMYWMN